jgi:hypothetical protein
MLTEAGLIGTASGAPYRRFIRFDSRVPVFATLLAVLTQSPASGQGQACRGLDDNSKFMISDLKKLVSSTNQQEAYQRRDLKIPLVDLTVPPRFPPVFS